MKPKFDISDHFKGNFSKPEDYSLKKALKKVDDAFDLIYDALERGLGENFEWLPSPNKKDYPGIFCDEEGIEPLEIECQHDPIDVGFNSPKMVCSKCDKDLK